jgi:hypothetical protein
MTHKAKSSHDKPALDTCDDQRVFTSPVVRAFVRIVAERRGITETQALQSYLDYINLRQPGRERRPGPSA